MQMLEAPPQDWGPSPLGPPLCRPWGGGWGPAREGLKLGRVGLEGLGDTEPRGRGEWS